MMVKKQVKQKQSFGSVASEKEVAVAIGNKNYLPPNLHEMKKNEKKCVRENLKCHNQAQVESDNLFYTESKSKNVLENKLTKYPVQKYNITEAKRNVS